MYILTLRHMRGKGILLSFLSPKVRLKNIETVWNDNYNVVKPGELAKEHSLSSWSFLLLLLGHCLPAADKYHFWLGWMSGGQVGLEADWQKKDPIHAVVLSTQDNKIALGGWVSVFFSLFLWKRKEEMHIGWIINSWMSCRIETSSMNTAPQRDS